MNLLPTIKAAVFMSGLALGFSWGMALMMPVQLNVHSTPYYHGAQSTITAMDLQPAEGSDDIEGLPLSTISTATAIQPQTAGADIQSTASVN